MKLNEIQELIKFVSKSGATCVEIEQPDFKITIKTESKVKTKKEVVAVPAVQPAPVPVAQVQAPAPAPAPIAAPAPAPAENGAKGGAAEDESNYITINAPMVGTFYRSSGPDKDAFINVGDDVKPGKVLCIVEAMKLFNEIESEVSGKIVKVLVDDATPVEYDQPLFLVDPA